MSALTSHRLGRYLAVVLLWVFAPFASAQTANMVLLQSLDKSVAVSGQLIEAAGGEYQLDTIAGVISIDVNAVTCTGAACPLVVPVFERGAVVNLTSSDGALNITGNITDIVDDHYLVDTTVMGSVRIGTDVVDCSGPGCPTGLSFANDLAGSVTEAPASEIDVEPTPESPVVTDEAEPKPEATSSVVDAEPKPEATASVVEAEPKPEATASVVEAEPKLEATASVDEAEINPVAETQSSAPENARVSFAGSDTVGLGLLPFLLDDYADSINATAQTEVISETETFVRYVGPDETELNSIYVNATGSGDATDALETKAAVFGMTSRRIKDEEASRLVAAGSRDLRNTDNETVIAVDSLAVITHPTNPVKELSLTELGSIYLGQIDNWSQVGGIDAPITVLSREDGSSTRGVFEKTVFDGGEPQLAERVTYPGGDNPEIAALVKDDPLAIGYVGFAYSEGLNRVDLTSSCGITYRATPFSVKTEEYPLGRRLYLYNRLDNIPAEAKNFLDYVLSPEADDAISKSSFVNFAVEREALSASRYDDSYEGSDEPSIAQLANELKDDLSSWDRLSTTIRFRSGSFRLGKKEQNDIDRLVSALSELPAGTQIAAVGFADDLGPFDDNLRLSQLRAQTVADAIKAVAVNRTVDVRVDTRAFSELSPSVCNTADIGRAINRRVEIWIGK